MIAMENLGPAAGVLACFLIWLGGLAITLVISVALPPFTLVSLAWLLWGISLIMDRRGWW